MLDLLEDTTFSPLSIQHTNDSDLEKKDNSDTESGSDNSDSNDNSDSDGDSDISGVGLILNVSETQISGTEADQTTYTVPETQMPKSDSTTEPVQQQLEQPLDLHVPTPPETTKHNDRLLDSLLRSPNSSNKLEIQQKELDKERETVLQLRRTMKDLKLHLAQKDDEIRRLDQELSSVHDNRTNTRKNLTDGRGRV